MFSKKKNLCFRIILAVLAASILLGGPYLLLQSRKSTKDVSSEISSGSPKGVSSKISSEISSEKYKNISQLKYNESTLEDVIRLLGEPKEYRWGDKKFTKDNLPSDIYVAFYEDESGFGVDIAKGVVNALRVRKDVVSYGSIHIGTSMDEVIKVLGEPKKVEENFKTAEIKAEGDRLLYTDLDGKKGYGHYSVIDKGVRMFFENDKVEWMQFWQPGTKM